MISVNIPFQTFEQKTVENLQGTAAGCDVGGDVADNAGHIRVAVHHVFNFPDGAERGGVIASELFADVVERQIGKLPHQIHGNLPRHGRVFGTVVSLQVFRLQRIILRRFADDEFRFGNIGSFSGNVLNRVVNDFAGDLVVHNLLVGCQAFNDALQLTDIRRDGGGNVFGNIIRQKQAEAGGFVPGDCHPNRNILPRYEHRLGRS